MAMRHLAIMALAHRPRARAKILARKGTRKARAKGKLLCLPRQLAQVRANLAQFLLALVSQLQPTGREVVHLEVRVGQLQPTGREVVHLEVRVATANLPAKCSIILEVKIMTRGTAKSASSLPRANATKARPVIIVTCHMTRKKRSVFGLPSALDCFGNSRLKKMVLQEQTAQITQTMEEVKKMERMLAMRT